MKYETMFEEAESEEELIASLGNPTKLAIALALNYVPSPAPVSAVPDTVEPGDNQGEFAAGISEERSEEAPKADAGEAAPEEAEESGETPEDGEAAEAEETSGGAKADEAVEAADEEPEEELPAPARGRKVRPFGLIVAILFGLIIGVPVALVLILIGVPFLVSGLAVIAADVWAVLAAVPYLALISDILVVVGVGLVIGALGLLVTWFGLWLSFELGYLWIGGVVLRLGRALTYKKEVAAK